ncbi:hypothetical protein J7384_15840 [Endozoicomonas sp. G2_1]|uniref:hypothetical protein n=1 Tax=Endozoicomonas sp. G2_1 TaxID=2821091 RepID=UPI001AD9CE44|nr:hypothetical protein [Endozoicomonas sp. G2_1]MBO9491831.1 hypothetical protein [Endozoicomonas sp. G2_1]
MKLSGEYYTPPNKWQFDAIKRRYLSHGVKDSNLDIESFERYEGIIKVRYFLKAISECVVFDDPAAIDISVDFVVSPVYFHYSGYIRQTMARRLKSATLSSQQITKIIKGVQSLISSGKTGEEFEQINKLYLKVSAI